MQTCALESVHFRSTPDARPSVVSCPRAGRSDKWALWETPAQDLLGASLALVSYR